MNDSMAAKRSDDDVAGPPSPKECAHRDAGICKLIDLERNHEYCGGCADVRFVQHRSRSADGRLIVEQLTVGAVAGQDDRLLRMKVEEVETDAGNVRDEQ